MKIYIAGTFEDQKALRGESDALWQLGHEVVSTWLNETKRSKYLTEDEQNKKLALKDVVESCIADCIILDNRQRSSGKNTEWGVGIHSFHHKLLWIVGRRTAVFHSLADKHFDTWQDVFDYLRQYKEIYK